MKSCNRPLGRPKQRWLDYKDINNAVMEIMNGKVLATERDRILLFIRLSQMLNCKKFVDIKYIKKITFRIKRNEI